MLILRGPDVPRALEMPQAIQAMKRAFAAFSAGKAQAPLRLQLPVAPHRGMSLFMPAYVHDDQGDALAVKVVSVFPENKRRDLPIIHAAVLVLEASTGRPLALLEGGTLTAIRTGAASGAATDLLARPDSRVLALFGAGVQGRTQVEAVCWVRPIERVWVYDPTPEKAAALAESLAGVGPIPQDVRVAYTPGEALAEADVVCTATTSPTPVFTDEDLKPGVHINAVGAYTPEMAEIPPETVARALVVVDSRQAALAEAGDLIQPLQDGRITEEHIAAELGEIVLGHKPGRTDPEQITLFKSVGLAVQDAVAAKVALHNALEQGLGERVTW